MAWATQSFLLLFLSPPDLSIVWDPRLAQRPPDEDTLDWQLKGQREGCKESPRLTTVGHGSSSKLFTSSKWLSDDVSYSFRGRKGLL